MNQKYILIILSVLLGFSNCLKAQSTSNNKIYVSVVGDAEDGYKKVIRSSISKSLSSDGTYSVIERAEEFQSTMEDEIAYQESGSVKQTEIVETSIQMGANFVFAVDVSSVLGELFASSRIINIEKANVIASSEYSQAITDMASLRNFASKIANLTLAELPENKAKAKKEARRQKQLQQEQKEKADATNYLKNFRLFGPFNNAYSLSQFKVPAGYRMAHLHEIRKIQQCNNIIGNQNYTAVYSISRKTRQYDKKSIWHYVECYYVYANGYQSDYEYHYKVDKKGNITYNGEFYDQMYIYCYRTN